MFELFLLKNWPQLSGKLPQQKQFTLVLKTTCKKFFLARKCKVSTIVFNGLWEYIFELFLLKKKKKKPAVTQKEITSSEKSYTCSEEYLAIRS